MFVSKITYEFHKSPLHSFVDVVSKKDTSKGLDKTISVINKDLINSFDEKFSCNKDDLRVLFQVAKIDTKCIIFKGIFANLSQLKDIYKTINVSLSKFTNLKCKNRISEEISINDLTESFYGTRDLKAISIKSDNKKALELCEKIKFLSNSVSSLDVSYWWNVSLNFENWNHAIHSIINEREFNAQFFRLYVEMCSCIWVFKPIFLKLGNDHDPDEGNIYYQYLNRAFKMYVRYLQAAAYKAGYIRNGNTVTINRIPKSIYKQTDKINRYLEDLFYIAKGGTIFINIYEYFAGYAYKFDYLPAWNKIIELCERYRHDTLIIFGTEVCDIANNKPTVYSNDIEKKFNCEIIGNGFTYINIYPEEKLSSNEDNPHRLIGVRHARKKPFVTTRSKQKIWKYLIDDDFYYGDISERGFSISELFHTRNKHKYKELDESVRY